MRCTGFRNQQRGEQRTAIGQTVDADVWPEAKMQEYVNWIPRPEWLNPGNAARSVERRIRRIRRIRSVALTEQERELLAAIDAEVEDFIHDRGARM